jgi:hypothetical protein
VRRSIGSAAEAGEAGGVSDIQKKHADAMREERKRRRAERALARQEKLIADAFAALQLSADDIHFLLCLLPARRNGEHHAVVPAPIVALATIDRIYASLRQARRILQQRGAEQTAKQRGRS